MLVFGLAAAPWTSVRDGAHAWFFVVVPPFPPEGIGRRAAAWGPADLPNKRQWS